MSVNPTWCRPPAYTCELSSPASSHLKEHWHER
jgi:hypothetical protein